MRATLSVVSYIYSGWQTARVNFIMLRSVFAFLYQLLLFFLFLFLLAFLHVASASIALNKSLVGNSYTAPDPLPRFRSLPFCRTLFNFLLALLMCCLSLAIVYSRQYYTEGRFATFKSVIELLPEFLVIMVSDYSFSAIIRSVETAIGVCLTHRVIYGIICAGYYDMPYAVSIHSR